MTFYIIYFWLSQIVIYIMFETKWWKQLERSNKININCNVNSITNFYFKSKIVFTLNYVIRCVMSVCLLNLILCFTLGSFKVTASSMRKVKWRFSKRTYRWIHCAVSFLLMRFRLKQISRMKLRARWRWLLMTTMMNINRLAMNGLLGTTQ